MPGFLAADPQWRILINCPSELQPDPNAKKPSLHTQRPFGNGAGAGIEKFSLSLYWKGSGDLTFETYHQKYHQSGHATLRRPGAKSSVHVGTPTRQS
jgi:hypothetical protein